MINDFIKKDDEEKSLKREKIIYLITGFLVIVALLYFTFGFIDRAKAGGFWYIFCYIFSGLVIAAIIGIFIFMLYRKKVKKGGQDEKKS